MRTLACCCGLLFCLLAVQFTSAQPGPEPIRFGTDEVVVPAAELSEPLTALLPDGTKLDVSVGFAWRCAYLFSPHFSLWNWHGRYVLYDGGNVLEVTPEMLEFMLGKPQVANLRPPPLAYRIPAGLVTLVSLALVGGALLYFVPTQFSRTQRFMKDPQYVQAVEVYERTLPAPEEESTADLRKHAFATAVEFLTTAKSLTKPQAEANLRTIISWREEQKSKYLREQALAYEEAGNWDEALDLYEEAAELRELWDPKDYAYLQKCIARVEKKQAAST